MLRVCRGLSGSERAALPVSNVSEQPPPEGEAA
jgi:hypothetical protein